MSWMPWNREKSVAPLPRSNEEIMHSMRIKRDAMQRRRDAIERQIRDADAEAHRAAAEGNRMVASTAIKRRRAREQEVAQVSKLIEASNRQMAAIEQASLSASMAETVRDGAAVMSSVHSQLDPAAVERDMSSMQVQARESDYITRLMTRPLGSLASAEDEADLDNEEDAAIADELASIMQSATMTADAPIAPSSTPIDHFNSISAASSSSSSSTSSGIAPSTPSYSASSEQIDLKKLEASLGL